ncbi:monooxygenase [Xylanibacillus composti]|uniref:Monooxygenase n=2 Tax=Xylanibacillus composti TaxID=1572762 RepID=A0A8J4M2Y0_9BACL|nr:LLM class flavin-dependent oxidoreductase [Xylanibacillus composti]GIQ69545.1 monooxygenase [Xylanibacillus composti]
MAKKEMHLGAFLLHTGHHVSAWRHPDSQPERVMEADYYRQLAQIAERGKFDMLFLADTLFANYANPHYFKHAVTTRPEPITLLSYLAGVTEHIGLAATVSTTYQEPYNLAREFAMLDHLSHGRAAWNIVTSSRDEEAANFGSSPHMEHSLRYERAREFAEVAAKLWDSWEDDATIADRRAGIFADPARVHTIHHRGEHFGVRGPLNLTRSPQGRPVFIQAGASDSGRRFAAEYAEVIFVAWQTFDEAKHYYNSLKQLLPEYGRSPEAVKVLPGILPIIGSTEQEARDKEALLQELVLPELGLSMLSSALGGADLSDAKWDGPLPSLPDASRINGGKSRFQLISDLARREQLTVRELIYRVTGARGHRTIAGTPEQIADHLTDWFIRGACDGFNIMPPVLPGGLEEFVDQVVPILQNRGLFRTAYTSSTLRGHLGLARPDSQFAASTV